MPFHEILKQTLSALWETKLRSFLTMFGIVWGITSVILLTIDDAVAIQQQASLVKTVSPELRRSVAEVSQWNAANRPIRGVWPQYQRFRSLTVEQGRLMSEQDEAEGARVILLGSEANRQLFPGKAVIGQPLMVAGYQYTVIGV